MKMTQADNATGVVCIDVHHFVCSMHKSPSAAIERHLTTPFQALKSTSCCSSCHEQSDHTVDYEAHTTAHAPTHPCQEKTIYWSWPLMYKYTEGWHRKVGQSECISLLTDFSCELGRQLKTG